MSAVPSTWRPGPVAAGPRFRCSRCLLTCHPAGRKRQRVRGAMQWVCAACTGTAPANAK